MTKKAINVRVLVPHPDGGTRVETRQVRLPLSREDRELFARRLVVDGRF